MKRSRLGDYSDSRPGPPLLWLDFISQEMFMARKRSGKSKTAPMPPMVHPDAAGIDIGATEIFVAVPADRDQSPVRSFQTFTQDLYALADWLQQCGIRTVAMESTGVYWIPLFQILEGRGLKVCLVNAHYAKNVPGRKTDICDCQWLQYLHAVGLLRASFRPEQEICAVRSLLRHREGLVQMASGHVQHMQKALDQMNLQIHHVISDITGVTGLAIIDAVLAGERNPHVLAKLRDWRIRASEETIAKSLVGDYRSEHLFTLRQSLKAYQQYQQLIAECDRELQDKLEMLPSKTGAEQPQLPPPKPGAKKRKGNDTNFDLRGQHYRILGVDLTAVPGMSSLLIHTILSEVGPDLSKFPTDSAFASWLGLCPNNDISGGKVLRAGTRKVANRAAKAFRLAAHTLHHSHCAIGQFYRRMRAKLGPPQAVTATAHKLARIVYHLLRTGQAYDESVFARDEERYTKRVEKRLKAQARALGFQLVPAES
jgi:transposase